MLAFVGVSQRRRWVASCFAALSFYSVFLVELMRNRAYRLGKFMKRLEVLPYRISMYPFTGIVLTPL